MNQPSPGTSISTSSPATCFHRSSRTRSELSAETLGISKLTILFSCRHYNSFHPKLGFFLHLDDVIEQVKTKTVDKVSSRRLFSTAR